MTSGRILTAWHKYTVRAIQPGLARTRVLLTALGHPDRQCPAIQITGTNGKGSVAALLESALRQAGFRTGRFTSPHLAQERERIAIAGRPITQRAFENAARVLLPYLKQLKSAGNPATTFEAWTVLAAEAFRQARVDVAVLEVGMGGRLDATSAWNRVVLSVVTRIRLDHTRELGPDVYSIAREKIAIGRPGIPLVSGENISNLRDQIRLAGRKHGFPVFFAGSQPGDEGRIMAWQRTGDGALVDLNLQGRDIPGLRVALAGEHQVRNAALAALALTQLSRAGFPVDEQALRAGFARVEWPGRLETLGRSPEMIVDGAHNPDAAQTLADEILATRGPVVLITGIMADKDVAGVTREFARIARQVFTVSLPSERSLSAEDLASWFVQSQIPVQPCRTVRQALREALAAAGASGTVLAAGSLYLVEPVKRAWKQWQRAQLKETAGTPTLLMEAKTDSADLSHAAVSKG